MTSAPRDGALKATTLPYGVENFERIDLKTHEHTMRPQTCFLAFSLFFIFNF
jgi:hypothetical protein